MDRVFSVDEFSEHFWSAPMPTAGDQSPNFNMNRSASEWALQRFLQEEAAATASVSVTLPSDASLPSSSSAADRNDDVSNDQPKQDGYQNKNMDAVPLPQNGEVSPSVPSNPNPTNIPVPLDSDDYQAFLKTQLDLACAAVAMTRGSLLSNPSEVGSQPAYKGAGPSRNDPSKIQDKDAKAPAGVPSIPAMQKKPADAIRPATSGSSREQSDDEEAEGETDMNESMDRADAKRAKRMLSNRESARRSRRRKQAHLTELETQVSQLRGENASLLRRLTDVSQKHSEAAVDNRVLKADVETLRAKVKMAEETVKRITGLNPRLHVMSEISSLGMPSFDGSPSDTSGDAAVPVQDDSNHHFYQPTSNNPLSSHDLRVNSGLGDISPVENVQQNAAAAVSLQRVASLEHLQKRIRGGVDSCGPSNTEQ